MADIVPLDAIWLPAVTPAPPGTSDTLTLVGAERRAILAALEATRWRISGEEGAAETVWT